MQKIYEIILELKSPLQIGAGTLGMIEKTELFIPGRVLWGAFVSTLVQKHFIMPGKDIYLQVGNSLKKNDFSTFFPSLDGGKSDLKPVFEKNLRDWIIVNKKFSKTESEMNSLLLCSVASNATNPERMATDDSSLHTTDMISQYVNDGFKKNIPVTFKGYLSLPASIIINDKKLSLGEKNIIEIINSMRIGGGRKRGWGIIECVNIQKDKSDIDFEYFESKNHKYNRREIPVTENDANINGRAYLAVYREYDNNSNRGFGQKFSEPILSWRIGSCFN